MKISILFFLCLIIKSISLPIAVFHGLGDNCHNPGMADFTKLLGTETGFVSHCFETGAGFSTSFLDQCKTACEQIQKHQDFQGDFSVIGLSQGGLIARYIIENCNTKGFVRNIVSVGGPQMGVSKFPHCSNHLNPFCILLNGITDESVYTSFIQNNVGPAGYFRTNKDIDNYYKRSTLLAPLNNESSKDDSRRERLISIKKMHLVMFTKDTMIIPKETAWFGYWNEKGELKKITDSDIYKNDLIGLRELNEKNVITYDEINGDHLQFTKEDIKNKMIPYLR